MPEKSDKNILDELKLSPEHQRERDELNGKRSDVHEDKNEDKHDNKLAKKIMFGLMGTAALAGIGTGVAMHHNQDKPQDNPDKSQKDTIGQHKEDPYKSFSESRAKQIEIVDKAVKAAVDTRTENKPESEIFKAADKALEANRNLKGDDSEMKNVRYAFAQITNTVKAPTETNLRDARTSISEIKDTSVVEHLEDTYQATLVKQVAKATNKTEAEVEKATKPLTAAQKAQNETAAAEDARIKAQTEQRLADEAAANKKAQDDANAASNASQPTDAPEATPQSTPAAPAQAPAQQQTYQEPQQTYQEPQQQYQAPTPAPAPAPSHAQAPSHNASQNNAAQQAARNIPEAATIQPTPGESFKNAGTAYGMDGVNGYGIDNNW